MPYHEAFADHVQRAAGKLREAAAFAEDPGFRKYLELRANALLEPCRVPRKVEMNDDRGLLQIEALAQQVGRHE